MLLSHKIEVWGKSVVGAGCVKGVHEQLEKDNGASSTKETL